MQFFTFLLVVLNLFLSIATWNPFGVNELWTSRSKKDGVQGEVVANVLTVSLMDSKDVQKVIDANLKKNNLCLVWHGERVLGEVLLKKIKENNEKVVVNLLQEKMVLYWMVEKSISFEQAFSDLSIAVDGWRECTETEKLNIAS